MGCFPPFESGQYILGPEVEAFEAAFAKYLGLHRVVSCGSGTDALELALRALGIGPDKAVFTVLHTAVATVAAVERTGGTPVLTDVDEATCTIDASSLQETVLHLRKARSDIEPAAVIPVHLYGCPCDMDVIQAVASRHGLDVLEDCAQAHGARYKGKIVGSMGRAAAFSFYPSKNLGALGDGGGVAVDDAALAEEMASLRQYGWKQRYISSIPGINSRLDPVQAAILQIQLQYLNSDNAARRRIAAIYNSRLAANDLVLPVAPSWAEHVYHLYVVRCPERTQFMDFLHERNIGTAIHYPQPVHLQPAYTKRILLAPGGLPVTERIREELVSLPIFPQLGERDVDRICTAVQEWARAGF